MIPQTKKIQSIAGCQTSWAYPVTHAGQCLTFDSAFDAVCYESVERSKQDCLHFHSGRASPAGCSLCEALRTARSACAQRLWGRSKGADASVCSAQLEASLDSLGVKCAERPDWGDQIVHQTPQRPFAIPLIKHNVAVAVSSTQLWPSRWYKRFRLA